MNLPIPSHLVNLLVTDCKDHNEFSVSGDIECTCGCRTFNIIFIGVESKDNKSLYTTEPDDLIGVETELQYIMSVELRCTECNVSHLIFDNRVHGWDGYIREGITIEALNGIKKEKQCPSCQHSQYKMHIEINSCGIEDFKLNMPEKPWEEWTEGFEWFRANITCTNCKREDKDWASVECM